MADIDTVTSARDFGSSYPLPFRVLFLSSATLLGFATNLHLLAYLGIDTSLVLDIRLDDWRGTSTATTTTTAPNVANSRQPSPFVHPSRLYPPLYTLAGLAMVWIALGWLAFMKVTGGDPQIMVQWRALPIVTAGAVGLAAVIPLNVLYKRERMMFLRSLRRIVLGPLYSPVPFSDIILADILTSSAKVLGDLWVSGCVLFTATKTFGVGSTDDLDEACARVWMVPVMTSLPYIFRFRQCISEILTGSTPTPHKSLANAVKYATAFPVIFFSAMQTVIGDPFDDGELVEVRWISRDTLFYLWILSVLVNSMYSFWWDITNDWGLSLLTKEGWSSSAAVSYAFIGTPANGHQSRPSRSSRSTRHAPNHSITSALAVPGPPMSEPPPPSRPHSPTLGGASTPSKSSHTRAQHSRAFSTAAQPNVTYPFLRPILLLPDPLVYYLAIAMDLILRFTWSLKLSSHLHTIHEQEGGVFLMEFLEVVRRWMWVYIRVEWEAIRKGGGQGMMDKTEGEDRLRMEEARIRGDEEAIELVRREQGGYRDDEDQQIDDQVGLGIHVQVPRPNSWEEKG